MPNTIFDSDEDQQQDIITPSKQGDSAPTDTDRTINDMERQFDQPIDTGRSSATQSSPSTVNDLETSSNSLYRPDSSAETSNTRSSSSSIGRNTGAIRSRLALMGKKKKRLIGGGILGLLIGGGFFGFSIISGPLQFIHASQLLGRFHFSRVENFGDRSSAKFITYALAGKSAQGRLGANGNRRANKWEARLNENGLRSVYQTGTQRGIGYEVRDPVKAKPFLDNLRRQGFDVDAPLPGNARYISGDTIEGGARGIDLSDDSFRTRNVAIRTATQSLGVNRIRGTMASRLLIKRSGTDGLFHPFRNKIRRSADTYAVWRQERREEDRNRQATGDANLDPADTRLGRLRSRISTTLRTARTPVAIAAATCGLKTFSDSIDEQNYQNQLAMTRIGVGAIAKGEQIKSMDDFNMEVLSVASEHFYNEENNTSWLDDPGVQYELNQDASGRDYLAEKDIKPGSKEKPGFFRAADRIPTGFGIGEVRVDVCDAFNAAGEFVSDLPLIGDALELIGQAADIPVRTITGKDVEEWIDTARDYFANGNVDVMAEGSEWGGLANTGARLAANDQMIASGGRQLSDQEADNVLQAARNQNDAVFAESGFYNRYLNLFESQSMTAKLFQQTPKTGGEFIANIGNIPQRFMAMLSENLSGAGRVYAAQDYDYGFSLYGFSIDEQNRHENPFENAEWIETGDRLEELNDEYGNECFGMTISPEGDLNYSDAPDFTKINNDKCAEDKEELVRYRTYIADIITVHTLDCYEDLSEDSCRQLGFGQQDSTAIDDTRTTVQGVESPPNLGEANSEGYYQMPPAQDGSYQLNTNGGSPPSQQCGSKELVDVTYTLLKRYNETFGESLGVGDLNASGHASHTKGIDVDIYAAPYNPNKMTDHEKAIQLGKWAYDTGMVETIGYSFPEEVNQEVNSYAGDSNFMQNWSGHEDHFHLRLNSQYEGVRSTSCAQ